MLALQYPLPQESQANIPTTASLAYRSESADQEFILSSNLSLPPSFGTAYVGEAFSCSLCANNDLAESTVSRVVSGLRIVAEMQTPTQAIPLLMHPPATPEEQAESKPGSSLQKNIRFDLKEEGNHILAVNVSYTETTQGSGSATGGRVRSFRKLYQFVAQPCLTIRTKATDLPSKEVEDKSFGPYGRSTLVRYVLEAQIENASANVIAFEQVHLQPRPPFKSKSMNWDSAGHGDPPSLAPRDIYQVAFIVEQQVGVKEGLDELKEGLKRDGRVALGQLGIQWRSTMGEKGSLNTGNLFSRKRMS